MKRLFTLGVILLLAVTVLGPSQSQAFNPGAHIYIAEQVFPYTFDKINLYYGSIAPDIALYVTTPTNWPNAFCETHYKFTKLPYAWWNLTQKAFAKGWQTHNEAWGADSYAHGTCNTFHNCCKMDCGYHLGYVNIQAGRLVEFFDALKESEYGLDLGHFAIEVAIDVLLARYYDPSLGLKVLLAAKYRSKEDLNVMLKTFVRNEGPDEETLIEAENEFRDLVINYATALALPDPLRIVALGELGSQVASAYGVSIDPVEARWIIRVAMYLCQDSDYMEVIQSAIEGISSNSGLIR